MEITINAVKFKADDKLVEFIEKKVQKIETLLSQAIKVEVALNVDKEHDINNKIADIRVIIPNYDLFASKQCDTFEEAVGMCVDAIKKQIEKLKEKQRG